MADVFRTVGPDHRVQRAILGLSLFGLGEVERQHGLTVPFPYRDRPPTWGRSAADSQTLALTLLAHCLDEESTPNEGWEDTTSWRLHERFAEDVISRLDPASPLSLEWSAVQAWIDDHTAGEPGVLTRCIQRVRDFEATLRAALAEDDPSRRRHANPAIWRQWDIETIVSLCAMGRDLLPSQLSRFADHLLDLKFKLYCLLEVDVPAYAAAIRTWGLAPDDLASTPQGFAARLSEEVTLVVKSRAVWESVMNAVYWYATGRQTPTSAATDEWGVTFRSKTAKFFPWVAKEPLWSSLATFEPLVDALDQLRTPEVHHLSRVRSDFTRLVLRPIEQCVELLQAVLAYVFDHIVTVIALRRGLSYDASARGAAV